MSRSTRRPRTDARLQVEADRVGGHAIVHAHRRRAVAQQLGQLDLFFILAVGTLGVQPSGVEHLVDQVVEPLQVFEHEAVEVGLQLLAHLVAAEGLQVELHRRDGRLQFVGDAVDEVRLPAGKVDGLDRQDQVEHHADHQQQDERRADRQQRPIEAREAGRLSGALNTVTSTQPMATTTSKVIIAMASRIGVLRERRSDIMGENSRSAYAPSSRGDTSETALTVPATLLLPYRTQNNYAPITQRIHSGRWGDRRQDTIIHFVREKTCSVKQTTPSGVRQS